jgi:hypothetical protein
MFHGISLWDHLKMFLHPQSFKLNGRSQNKRCFKRVPVKCETKSKQNSSKRNKIYRNEVNCALRDKIFFILILVLSGKKILNETKNHTPPLHVKWSVPYKIIEANCPFAKRIGIPPSNEQSETGTSYQPAQLPQLPSRS